MKSILSNPYFKKVSKQDDVNSGKPATYGSIGTKILFFLILTCVGVCLSIFLSIPDNFINYVLIGAGVTVLISSLINFFVPKATPVFGSLFCIAEGYLIGWICQSYAKVYEGIIPMALVITFSVIFIMLFLYATKIIKVGQRFKAVVSTLFLTSIVLGVLVFISSFFTDAISSIVWGNGVVGIAISLGVLLIAALNLVIDFDNIAQSVKKQYSNKYEWSLAFGLVMTVILIFVRVLNLLAKIMSTVDN